MNLNKHNKSFDFEEGQDHRIVKTNVWFRPYEKNRRKMNNQVEVEFIG